MPIYGERARYSSLRIGLLHISNGIAQSTSFVCREGDERLVVEVVFLEKGEHHLGISAPPDRTADKDGVILSDVFGLSLERRQ